MSSTLRVLSLLALAVGTRQQPNPLPVPLPFPNTHFPAELAGGVQGTTSSAGTSQHLRVSVTWSRGGNRVIVKWNERPSAQSPWYETIVEDSTSYTITALADREGGRELFVAGVKRDGTKLIQKWSYPARLHGYALSAGGVPPPAVGTSMPEFQPSELINGEGFVAPQGGMGSSPTREILWESPAGGVISGLVADPEGRYLFLLSYPNGMLRRLDLVPQVGVPQQVLSPQEQPFLGGATSLAMWHHSAEGRKIAVSRLEGSTVHPDKLLLSDSNNDGLYESAALFSPSAWNAAGYGDHQAWRYYWNTGVTFDWD